MSGSHSEEQSRCISVKILILQMFMGFFFSNQTSNKEELPVKVSLIIYYFFFFSLQWQYDL